MYTLCELRNKAGDLEMMLLNTQVDSQTFTAVPDAVKTTIFPDIPWQEYTVGGFPVMVKVMNGVVVALMTLAHVRVNNAYLELVHT